MAVGLLRYSTCFFTCSALLLLGVSINDVEASSCQHVIHKKVGDTVELSSCLPTDWVTQASWKYGGKKIADKDQKHIGVDQFKDRLELNPQNFSLTVKRLTLQDSGNFSFTSGVNDTQRRTVIISLQVHESITKQPTLTYNSTWHTSNESCTVFLECSAASDSVDYKWTVRNQTRSGSRLQYILNAQDGDTDFTCTIYNFVTEMSASQTVTCKQGSSSSSVPLIILLVIGILLILVLLPSLLCYTKSKGCCCNRLTQSPTQVKPAETQEQVYSSLLHGDGCVYETIRGPEDAGAGERPNSYVNVTSAGEHGR